MEARGVKVVPLKCLNCDRDIPKPRFNKLFCCDNCRKRYSELRGVLIKVTDLEKRLQHLETLHRIGYGVRF